MQVSTLVNNCDSDQSWLTGIETQHQFPTFNYWLTCRHVQTINYVVVQTLDLFPQIFLNPTGWNSQKNWKLNAQKLPTLQLFQSFSHKSKTLFFNSCLNEFIRFLCKCTKTLLKGTLQSIKRHHVVARFQKRCLTVVYKMYSLEAKKGLAGVRKIVTPLKIFTLPVINDLSWYGAVCPRSCFCVQPNLITQSVTKNELPKYQFSQNPTYRSDSFEKEKKINWKIDSSIDKSLSCPRNKLSVSQTLILDGVERRISLLNFAQQLRRKNADAPDIYFILFDAAGLSQTLVLNQIAKAKDRRSWAPFEIWTSEAAKAVHTG